MAFLGSPISLPCLLVIVKSGYTIAAIGGLWILKGSMMDIFMSKRFDKISKYHKITMEHILYN